MVARRKILVLGANSFSGQDFVDLLLADPENDVIGVSRSPLRGPVFISDRMREATDRFRYYQQDINRQMPDLLSLLDEQQPQWVVNFAAQSEVAPSWGDPDQWFQTNCVALARLVNHLSGTDHLERFLQVSSPEVYGTCVGLVDEQSPLNPSTPYAASKAAADLLLYAYHRQYGFPLLTVRATNVYGLRQQLHKIVPRSAIYMRLGRKIQLHGGGRAIKSFIHIRDVSRGELAILQHGNLGEIYHLSPDNGIAVRDAVRVVCEAMNCRFEAVTQAVDERPGQDAAYVIDSSRARQSLGWRPRIGFPDGVQEVVDWVGQYWSEIQQLPLEYVHQP